MQYNESFRNNLNSLITSKGYTTLKFCEEIEIPPATIFRYLTGQRNPELSYLIRIADFFHVTIDWLIGRDIPENEIAQVFPYASDNDQAVINAILQKYQKHLPDTNR